MPNKYPTRQDLENLVLESKLSKTNWLLIGTYKPPSLSDIAFTSEISSILTFYRSTHDNIFFMSNFYMTLNYDDHDHDDDGDGDDDELFLWYGCQRSSPSRILTITTRREQGLSLRRA